IAAYDRAGWHTEEYIRREFFGPFSDFNVSIKIDKRYCVAATGVLQNPGEIGYGYDTKNPIRSTKEKKVDHGPQTTDHEEGRRTTDDRPRLTWNFKAEQVHDFAWAADTNYRHTS